MGSGESHLNVSLIVRGKITRQSPPTTTSVSARPLYPLVQIVKVPADVLFTGQVSKVPVLQFMLLKYQFSQFMFLKYQFSQFMLLSTRFGRSCERGVSQTREAVIQVTPCRMRCLLSYQHRAAQPWSWSQLFCPRSQLFCPRFQLFCPRSQLFCPRSQLFCPRSQLFCPRSQLFCPRSQLFCPIS